MSFGRAEDAVQTAIASRLKSKQQTEYTPKKLGQVFGGIAVG